MANYIFHALTVAVVSVNSDGIKVGFNVMYDMTYLFDTLVLICKLVIFIVLSLIKMLYTAQRMFTT